MVKLFAEAIENTCLVGNELVVVVKQLEKELQHVHLISSTVVIKQVCSAFVFLYRKKTHTVDIKTRK